MRLSVKRWFGLFEVYIIVAKWRPWFKRFNEGNHVARRKWGVFIVDRVFWDSNEFFHGRQP